MRTDLLLGQADDLLTTGRAGRAATLLAPVVGEEPGNVDAWLLLARAHLALRRPADALEAARCALRLDPHGLEALYWVSAAYTAYGRHDLAVAAAVTAGNEDPGNPRLVERHGRALLAAGRLAEAERVLAAGAEYAHYDADLQVAHGVALFAAGRPLSAREAYGRALALDPGHRQAEAELRRLAAAEQRIVDAESLLRVTDEFAELLRIPAGGRRPEPDGRGALAHLTSVAFAVCLAALLVLGVLDRLTPLDVPPALMLAVLCAAGSAACATALTRRTG
ncbi:tetratricopeptide repeat protein [Paractinoplanes globisporus]|uniref:Tetratricopeptide repeat protein n=1 Tax=Paractinoplanes globisporus TaxID=113565 RepID=A0ABW6WVB5_9ACTN|nr:tetratricopeptide repeat protein [Actinoplanes globisporus]